MKLSFTKKNKDISIEDLHQEQISPRKDWLLIMSIFSVTIFVVVIISAVTFYNLLHKENSDLEGKFGEGEVLVDLNRAQFNSALEFINSKKSALPVGIEPTSKP